jgi:hypothetical protein
MEIASLEIEKIKIECDDTKLQKLVNSLDNMAI